MAEMGRPCWDLAKRLGRNAQLDSSSKTELSVFTPTPLPATAVG